MSWDEVTLWESFVWYRPVDGCEVVTNPGRPPNPNATGLLDAVGMEPMEMIRAKSDRVNAYNPHLEQQTLFYEFANLGDTANAVCDFVARYGFLGERWATNPAAIVSEPVKDILLVRAAMSALLSLNENGRGDIAALAFNKEMRPVVVEYIDNTNPNRLLPVQSPMSLEGLLWLQFRDLLCNHRTLRKCVWERCPRAFYVGQGAATAARRFCSDRCKVAHTRKFGSLKNPKEKTS